MEIDRGEIDARAGIKFRRRLHGFLTSQHGAMHVHGNGVDPGGDHAFVTKLVQPFPTLHPGGLGDVAGQVARHAP